MLLGVLLLGVVIVAKRYITLGAQLFYSLPKVSRSFGRCSRGKNRTVTSKDPKGSRHCVWRDELLTSILSQVLTLTRRRLARPAPGVHARPFLDPLQLVTISAVETTSSAN